MVAFVFFCFFFNGLKNAPPSYSLSARAVLPRRVSSRLVFMFTPMFKTLFFGRTLKGAERVKGKDADACSFQNCIENVENVKVRPCEGFSQASVRGAC